MAYEYDYEDEVEYGYEETQKEAEYGYVEEDSSTDNYLGDYTEDEGQNPVYEEEYDVGNRTGFGGRNDIPLFQTRHEISLQSPEEKFRAGVNAVARFLQSSTGISQEDIDEMLDKTSVVKHPDKKSPGGFVLGYLAINKKTGKIMEPKKFSAKFIDIIPKLTRGNVTMPDILRYATLWESIY